MDIVLTLAIIFALLIANGFFVAAEFALIGAPRASIEAMAENGHRIAMIVRDVLSNTRRQDQYIATAQLGITLASLGLGMYGEHQIALWIEHALSGAEWLGLAGVHILSTFIAIAILTYLHIVLGEMIPKTLALQQAGRTALWVTPAMIWSHRLCFPLVFLLNGMGNGILRLMGIDRSKSESKASHTPTELQYIVQESQEGGLLTPEAGKLLQEMFDFDQLLAREVLVPRVKVTGIPLGADTMELSRIFRKNPQTRYPVYRETIDSIVGMMHVEDIFSRLRDGKPVALGDVRKVPFVPESSSLNQVLEAMRKEKTQLCVILDEFGGTEGIITLSDLFHEVVGKMPEEGSSQQGEIHFGKDGRLMVAGTARLNEVGESLKLALQHDEVDTISGLVLSLLDHLPMAGDKVEYGTLGFEVDSFFMMHRFIDPKNPKVRLPCAQPDYQMYTAGKYSSPRQTSVIPVMVNGMDCRLSIRSNTLFRSRLLPGCE